MIKTAINQINRKDRIVKIFKSADKSEKPELYQELVQHIAMKHIKKIFTESYADALEFLRGGYSQDFVIDMAVRILDKRLKDAAPIIADELGMVMEMAAEEGLADGGIGLKSIQRSVGLKKEYSMRKFIDIINEQNIFIIGAHAEKLTEEVRIAFRDQFKNEIILSNEDFAEQLSKILWRITDKDPKYWHTFADVYTEKVRNLGIVEQCEDPELNVEYFEVMAQIDVRTTEICRQMDGRIIPISHMTAQKKLILAADTLDKLQTAQHFFKKGETMLNKDTSLFNFDTSELPANVGIPPYHFGCRTTVVAFYPETFDANIKEPVGYETYNENFDETKPEDETNKRINQHNSMSVYTVWDKVWGRKIVLPEKTYNHVKDKHFTDLKGLKDAMANITEIAQSGYNRGDINAWTKNGYFISFRGGIIHTMFRPDNGYQYFKDESIIIGESIWEQLKSILKSGFTKIFTQ
ncbi:MAG: hypothetical protein LBH05_02120 [Deferribacteraceae bacterium]|jgi:hypothetical protein|nr:hypothetical protein [Deferribacteraceae bacterium]